ncbi:hypothetical protein GcM3_135019, partial [Golovinomyces cichoracearum]
MESLYNSLVYTYKGWATEYAQTEDSRSWVLEKFEDEKCLAVFGRTGLYSSIVIKENDNVRVRTQLEYMRISNDDFFMEPLLSLAEGCTDTLEFLFPDPSQDKMPVPICMSFYESKNIMFKIPLCMLCLHEDKTKVYVSALVIKRVIDDLSYKDIPCHYSGMRRGIPFNSLTLTDRCMNSALELLDKLPKRKFIKDCIPMYTEGFREYVEIDAIVTMCIVPVRGRASSDFGNDFVFLHGKRKLYVYVHSVAPPQRNCYE